MGMDAPEIIAVIRRRKHNLETLSSITDTSEVTVKRGDMTRMLIDEYGDILREIGGAREPGSVTERRAVKRP